MRDASRPAKILLRRIAGAIMALLLVATAIAAWATWMWHRDPLDSLEVPFAGRMTAAETVYEVDLAADAREYHDIILVDPRGDTLRVTLSLPAGGVERRLPVLILLGGAVSGRQSLRYVPWHGDNAIIAYEYPYDPERVDARRWYEGANLSQLPAIRRSVLAVPRQLRDLALWTREQAWADTGRISLLGFSFGAMFIPAGQRLLQRAGVEIHSTVIAYGGAELRYMLEANLQRLDPWVRGIAAWVLAALIRPVEPALHAAELKGSFLVINGSGDRKIPERCARRLQNLLPEPKAVLNLDTPHMHRKRPELARRLAGLSIRWLCERNAMDLDIRPWEAP